MPGFPYNDHQIREFVRMRKTIVGDKIRFKDFERESTGKSARELLEVEDGGIAKIELCINASNPRDLKTYRAALLVDYQRVRGVDYCEIERTVGFRVRIPAGWHQNIDFPNNKRENRHDALDLGIVSGLGDFARKVCQLWNIDYSEEPHQESLKM